jgi:hypothetical protein
MNIDAYFKEYGKRVTEQSRETMLQHIEKMLDAQKKEIKKIAPELEFFVFEIENKHLNVSVMNVDKDKFAIVFRTGILELILKDITYNYRILEEFEKDFELGVEGIIGIYSFFIYSFLLGHELGHVLYGHFRIDKTVNNIEEATEIEFNASDNETVKSLKQKYKKNLKKHLEINADMYGSVVFSLNLISLCAKKQDNGELIKLESLFRVAITSIYLLLNLVSKTHPKDSTYPHPMVRISSIINHVENQLTNIFDEKKIGFNIKKVFDEQIDICMKFQSKHDLGFCDMGDKEIIKEVGEDIRIAEEEFFKFFEDMKKYSYI